ncbi:DUF2855 family protein [Candidatus Microthrix parvicella]|jgi:hypothetical protein|uniref:DUF2855 family protein n=1 Tax=Candidatus Neomicrothrix parvicella TaxID=41950 RepID=UPI00037EE24F|nr:DUF2855 family protein [Candidatus Microthrix parvicella]
MTFSTDALEVNRRDTSLTRMQVDQLCDEDELGDGTVRMRVDRLAITANTVTYAEMGDVFGYWDFYPTGDDAWGRVPAMGWADVVASAHPDVEVGGRYYGWFPMVGSVDLAVHPTGQGLRDDGAHRAAHASVYRTFVDSRTDPSGPTAFDDAARRGDLEDRHALLRGLFMTGFLIDAFFDSNNWFGARRAIVMSASSKTAIAFADCAAQRGLDALIGVTSPGNVDFVRGLGRYSDVVSYDDIGSIATGSAVSVDMAGDGPAIGALHARLGDSLAHSMIVGRTHHDTPPARPEHGPTPEVFFAPTAMSQLAEGGTDALELQERSIVALGAFVEGSGDWLHVQRTTGAHAAAATWAEVHAGAVSPDTGRIVSLHR